MYPPCRKDSGQLRLEPPSCEASVLITAPPSLRFAFRSHADSSERTFKPGAPRLLHPTVKIFKLTTRISLNAIPIAIAFHPSLCYLSHLFLVNVGVELEHIPSCIGHRQDYTLGRSPIPLQIESAVVYGMTSLSMSECYASFHYRCEKDGHSHGNAWRRKKNELKYWTPT